MKSFIARNVTTARIFPPITPDLYKPASSGVKLNVDQSIARSLLTCSSDLPFRKHLARKRSGHDSLERAVFTHRAAFESEMAGEFERADFFWEELYRELSLVNQQDAWSSLALSLQTENPQLETLGDASVLRARFVEEVLIDTHAAFFNGYLRAAEWLSLDSRAWKHLSFLTDGLEWSGLSKEEIFQLIGAATESQLRLLEEAGRWPEVAERCALLIRYAANTIAYDDRLASAHFSQRVDAVKKGYPSATETHRIYVAINELTQLLPTYPLSRPLYKKLGTLYHDLSVRLAEAGEIAYALPAAQHAVTVDPFSTTYAAHLEKLTDTMNGIINEAKQCPRPGPRYNGTGPFLVDLARSGFKLLDEYKASEAAHRMGEAARVAEAANLWRRIGLPEKPADRLPEQAGKLLEAVRSIYAARPSTVNEIARAWRNWASRDQDLSEIDSLRVCSFLEKKLVKRAPVQGEAEAWFAFLEPVSEFPAQANKRAAPFRFWLLSRKDRRLKIRMAVAAVLFFIAGGAFLIDARARSVRTASYENILQGQTNKNYLQVIEGSEAFLSHPLVVSADDRDAEVIKRYGEAMVLWVARQPGDLTPEVTARVERYQQLVGNRSGGGL